MSMTEKKKKLIIKIGLLVILFILPILLILNFYNVPSVDDLNIEFNKIALQTPKEVAAQLATVDTNWSADSTQTIEIILPDNGTNPSSFEYSLEYDPTKLEAQEVSEQELWTDSIDIKEEIDNDTGKVYVASSQGIEASTTGSNTVATVSFKVIGEPGGYTSIILNPKSNIPAGSGTELIPLSASPLVVSISE